MGLKQCEKCNATAAEAKAFCPDCGHPFIEEQVRRELTEHDSFDGTMKLTQSSYNLMLAEMELDITEQPAAKVKPDPPAAAPAPAKANSSRPVFIVAGVVLLIIAVVLVFWIAQPFSK